MGVPVRVEPLVFLVFHYLGVGRIQAFVPKNFDSGDVFAKGLVLEQHLLVVSSVVDSEVVELLFFNKLVKVNSELLPSPLR